MKLGNKGVTIIELLIGMGVMAIMTFMAYGAMTMLSQRTVELNRKLETEIDHGIAERMIVNDLRNSSPSYNLMTQKDDLGRPFFDYEPERPHTIFTKAQYERLLTLSPSKTKEFYILQQDAAKGPVLIYDPAAAYNVGAPPADVNIAAPLQFVSLNRMNWIGLQRPNFWRDGQVLMLDTPARLRPVIGGVVDMNTYPRSPVVLGRVRGQDFVAVKELENLVLTTHPTSGTTISTADDFLRRLPSVGGGMPVVRIRAVQLHRYDLQAKPNVGGRPIYQLYRHEIGIDGKETSVLIADEVSKVEFFRPNVTQQLVQFRIVRADTKADEAAKGEDQ